MEPNILYYMFKFVLILFLGGLWYDSSTVCGSGVHSRAVSPSLGKVMCVVVMAELF